ncbi:glutamate/aspartate ABC transporter permease [Pseudomonas putida S11]|nr:glutamate/aspartate ABC transporter permease [Pseudomonas putida S11]
MNYNWDWGVFFKSTGVGSETYLDWYVTGLGWTIAIAISAWVIALLLGSVLGVMRTVPNRLVSGIATAYVELFRNVPLLVQLFIWYFLVPDLLPEGLQEWFKQDLNPTTSALISVVICLGLFTAARVCEQVRTGIQALPRGQEAAARAMGFSLSQIYTNVLLPQAYRIIIPPLTSEFLNVFKNSSVASLIGLMELLAQTKQTAEFSAKPVRGLHLGHADLLHPEHGPDAADAHGREESLGARPDFRRGQINGHGFQRNHPGPACPLGRHGHDPAADDNGRGWRHCTGDHPGP